MCVMWMFGCKFKLYIINRFSNLFSLFLKDISTGKSILFAPRLPEEYAVWLGKIKPLTYFKVFGWIIWFDMFIQFTCKECLMANIYIFLCSKTTWLAWYILWMKLQEFCKTIITVWGNRYCFFCMGSTQTAIIFLNLQNLRLVNMNIMICLVHSIHECPYVYYWLIKTMS